MYKTVGDQDDVVMVLYDNGYDVLDIVEYGSDASLDVQVNDVSDYEVVEDIMRNEFPNWMEGKDYEIIM